MFGLGEDNLTQIILALLGAGGAAAGAVWQFFVRPREKRLSDLEVAKAKLEKAQDEYKALVLAQNERLQKERDDANARTAQATAAVAPLVATLDKLTGVVTDGNKSVIEEIRVIRSTVEHIQRTIR